jgi:hypothetical protein
MGVNNEDPQCRIREPHGNSLLGTSPALELLLTSSAYTKAKFMLILAPPNRIRTLTKNQSMLKTFSLLPEIIT